MDRAASNSNFDSLQLMLKESVTRFLAEYGRGVTDFSNFTSIFSRFLQTLPDPPLEITWFYSALTFHSAKFTGQQSSSQVSSARDLFQLLVSCSSPHNAVTNIALLAPVICQLSTNLSLHNNCSRKEVESLLEGIVSYISISCGGISEEAGGLGSCFMDLVRVWLVDRIGENSKFGEELRLFFPIASEGVRGRVGGGQGCGGGGGVGCVAGIVMSEAFLLRLCLKFGCGSSRVELEEELRNCTVQMITAFRSVYFLDTILSMLLEPVLPVMSLLNPADEVFLREILYDAVILAEYLMLDPQKGIGLNGETLKNLAVTWLFFADNAIRSARENGDNSKVISYLQAFSESCLPTELVKWVRSQPGMQGEAGVPNISTPLALIKWLLIAEDQGIRVFGSSISITYARTIILKSTTEFELPQILSGGKNLGEDYLPSAGNEENGESKVNGDMEMIDSVDNMPLASPGLKALVAANGTRKRREGCNGERWQPVKFLKCHVTCNSSRERGFLLGDDGLISDSEVCNPMAVGEMEYMQH
ncbi:hypothetical protein Tsubulata_013212 [Turnera subulata]|uniref:Uncharacterized protein n=1 Tax=Turnera subulata TaxID=218843 RepID=A0A9Q0J9Q1_9ROSI|nr:hypothetical protein Tsubulata_013212 [Turnera subulata]